MQSTCSFPGCERPFRAKGLCSSHYRQRSHGQTLRPIQPTAIKDRFALKVDKEAPNGCWEWTGAVNENGYGVFSVGGRSKRAHRIAWELTNGPIPEGMVIDHRCSNTRCVNVAHLRVVTQGQNQQHRCGPTRSSTSGVRGVTWDSSRNKWAAKAQLNGRLYSAGRFAKFEDAVAAAKTLRAELFTHDDHQA